MILGVYIRNRKRDRWSLFTVSQDLELAKKQSKKLVQEFKDIGYDDADAIVQKFDNVFDIPATLEKVVSEKVLYN
jgi:hypothetical protein